MIVLITARPLVVIEDYKKKATPAPTKGLRSYSNNTFTLSLFLYKNKDKKGRPSLVLVPWSFGPLVPWGGGEKQAGNSFLVATALLAKLYIEYISNPNETIEIVIIKIGI